LDAIQLRLRAGVSLREAFAVLLLPGGLVGCGDGAAMRVVEDPGRDDSSVDAGVDEADAGAATVDASRDPRLPEPSTFACADLPSAMGTRACFDFNDGSSLGWLPEAGDWSVIDGMYVAHGPPTTPPPCGASLLTASLVDGFAASDVRIHAELTALDRVDKALVLRSTDASNRIELNFRAAFEMDGSDVIVQELVGCTQIGHARVPVPHEVGQTISVDVELVGSDLRIVVDGNPVLEQSFQFTATTGTVGVAVFPAALTVVDDVVAESLD
jgi:hypothetical protein